MWQTFLCINMCKTTIFFKGLSNFTSHGKIKSFHNTEKMNFDTVRHFFEVFTDLLIIICFVIISFPENKTTLAAPRWFCYTVNSDIYHKISSINHPSSLVILYSKTVCKIVL